MDCSSPYAMAPLVGLKDRFDIAFGYDPDADRHGIVTRGGGLMHSNHVLAAAMFYLFTHRSDWRLNAAVGKTMVSSSVPGIKVDLGAKPLEGLPGEHITEGLDGLRGRSRNTARWARASPSGVR
jgi:phosphoglucomutase